MATIAVYGSSRASTEDQTYLQAYAIGKALGAAGYTVMTGGYEGVMSAASQGAADAGAKVVGVTARPIEQLRQTQPNAWVQEVIPYDTLRERLQHLILNADAYVVMPGGIGTLCELVLAWELMRVRELPTRPLICFGDYWQKILAPLRNETDGYIPAAAWEFLHFADTPQAVVECIQKRVVIA